MKDATHAPASPTYEEALAFLLGHLGTEVEVTIGAAPGGGAPCIAELSGVLLRAEPHSYMKHLDRSYEGTEVLAFLVGLGGSFVLAARDFHNSEWVTDSRTVIGFDLGPVSVMISPQVPSPDAA